LAFILLILFYLLFGVPVFFFLAYGLILVYYGKRRRGNDVGHPKENSGEEYEPLVSVVIPTHNEEMIIAKKVENLLSSNYPQEKLEIIFVDDSDDSTPRIIEDKAKKTPNITLLRFNERMGYSPSAIAGCQAAKGEIIVLNDAGSFLDPNAIPRMIKRFRNPEIGVVTGKDVILNVDEQVGKSENLYQKIYNFIRTAETNMGSTFYIKGEATGVRSSVLKDLQGSTETFDTTAGLVAKQKGYKIVYDPEVKFYEYAPKTHSGRIKQKTIRAANLIKVLWRYRDMMFKPRYGKYGSLVMPMNFALLTFAPALILTWSFLLVVLVLLDLTLAIIVWAALGVVFALMLAFSRHLLATFLEFEYSLLRAIYQVVFTRKVHDKIDKVDSTRRI
jgi:cellulose synthase/poly-beta-1,6-N-acetylglucosamine synthase-like glycosyltransferase